VKPSDDPGGKWGQCPPNVRGASFNGSPLTYRISAPFVS